MGGMIMDINAKSSAVAFVILAITLGIWLLAVINIAGGKFLHEWHAAVPEKQVSVRIAQMSWFFFLLAGGVVSALVYFLWQVSEAHRIQQEKTQNKAAGNIVALLLEKAGKRAAVHWAVFVLCFFLFSVEAQKEGVLIVATLFSIANFMGHSLPLGLYKPIHGGVFYYLVRDRLPALQGMTKEQKREKISALLVAVCSKHPFQKWHGIFAWFVLAQLLGMLFMLTYTAGAMALLDEDLVPEAMVLTMVRWVAALFLFKVLVWDAVIAWQLHRLMKQEAGADAAPVAGAGAHV